MALRSFQSMAHSDDQLYDLSKNMPEDWEPPEYPGELQFSLPADVLAQCGAEGGEPNDNMRFSAMATVTSIFKGRDDCRIELEIEQFAGEDGKFVDLGDDDDMPWTRPSICFCQAELDKLGLEADCEMGDTIHLTGTARLENTSHNEFSGERVTLQIVELGAFEDESSESREG